MNFRHNVFRVLVVTSIAGSLGGPAHAQTEGTEPEWRGPTVTVGFAPVQLVFPIVEVTVEFRVPRRQSVAAIAGVGSVKAQGGERFAAWEVGGQWVYYPVGDFRHGMQLGAEVLYLHVGGDIARTQATTTGLSLSPLIGYKYTTRGGFTVNAQTGAQIIVLPRKDSMGQTSGHGTVIVLLNLNLGWSF